MRMDVLIVDNHPLSRKGLSAIVVGEGLSVRGAVGSAGEAWTILKTHVPDLIIVDIKLPDEKGPAFVHRLREVAPETPILVFTEDTSCLTTLFRGGVRGFVLKQGTRVEEELVEGIRTVLAGKYYASPEVCGAIGVVDRLSRREREVFEGLGRGMSLREIAERLGLSSKTIDTFFRRIKAKVGLQDNAEIRRLAARWVEEHGACALGQGREASGQAG